MKSLTSIIKLNLTNIKMYSSYESVKIIQGDIFSVVMIYKLFHLTIDISWNILISVWYIRFCSDDFMVIFNDEISLLPIGKLLMLLCLIGRTKHNYLNVYIKVSLRSIFFYIIISKVQKKYVFEYFTFLYDAFYS